MDSFVDCTTKAMLYINQINFLAFVMRHHMHTQLKVRIQNDFETVTLNNTLITDTFNNLIEVAKLNLEIFRLNITKL